jgi:hypothetical protein
MAAQAAPAPAKPAKPARKASAGTAQAGEVPVKDTIPGSGGLLKVLPYLTVVIAAFAPLAAAIYLVTSLAWSLAERKLGWRSAVATVLDRRQAPRGREAPGARPGRTVQKA